MAETVTTTAAQVALAESVTAHNYRPLPVVVAQAQGVWVTDVEGRKYLGALAAYSAFNSGIATRCCSMRPASSWSG
jgi:ornithine--oxo-acid transaminase